ncbi:MAG: glycosyltransferase family 39 protein [Planctomycetes bacterium]|nr:glycosyltransferase family 39 protein [Planctomycetota bacterium]
MKSDSAAETSTSAGLLSGPRMLAGSAARLRLGRGAAVIIMVAGLGTLPWLLSDKRPLSPREARSIAVAREMLASGNFVVPRLDGAPVTDQGPLSYWLIAGAMKAFGHESIWASRLPSGLAMIGTALVIAAMTARWQGSRFGLFTGLVQLTTGHAVLVGAAADGVALLTLIVAAAVAVFSLAQVDSPHGRRTARWVPCLFHVLVAVSFLDKLIAGPVLIMVACGGYFVVQRHWRDFKFLFHPLGQLLCGCLMLGWIVPLVMMDPPALDRFLPHHLFRSNATAVAPVDWRLGWLLSFPVLMLPWTPVMLWGVWQTFRTGVLTQPFWRMLGVWAVPGSWLLAAGWFRGEPLNTALLTPLSAFTVYGAWQLIRRRWVTYATGVPWRKYRNES